MKLFQFTKEHVWFLVILSVCIFLRFLPFFEYQFTLDELSGLNRTRFNSFSDLIRGGVKIDAHPAFVQVLIYYLVKFFGYSNWAIKLPFLLFSIGTVVYAYFFSLHNFSKQVALFATVVFSFSLVFVFYAPIARMYSSGIFFSVGLLFHFYEIFFLKKLKKQHFIFLGVFALLSALNQHINALFALSLCVSGLFFLNKQNIKPYVITCCVVVLCYLPHLPVTLYQLSIGGIGLDQGGWLEKPNELTLFRFLQILFGTGFTYLFLLGLLVFKNVADRLSEVRFKHIFLILIFLFNYFVVYLYSVFKASVYQHSVMLFAGTAMVLAFCSFLDFRKKYLFYPALVFTAALFICKTYLQKDFFNQCVETVFEYQFERTAHYKKILGEENVYPIFFDADGFMDTIYQNKYKTHFDLKLSSDNETREVAIFSHFVAGLKQDYLILSSSSPFQCAIAEQYFPYLIENTQTQANNFKLLSKRKSDHLKVVASERIVLQSSPKEANGFVYSQTEKKQWLSDDSGFKVEAGNDFPFSAKHSYIDLVEREGEMIQLSVKVKLRDISIKKVEACISVSDSLSGEVYLYNAKAVKDYVIGKDSCCTIFTDFYIGSKHEEMLKKPASITFYIWNPGKEKFTIQEFNIRVIDYWPQKWSFWK